MRYKHMLQRHLRHVMLIFTLMTTLLIVGCTRKQTSIMINDQTGTHAVPTISSAFGAGSTIVAEPTSDLAVLREPTANPTVVSQATIAALNINQLDEIVIYNDALNAEWSLENSFQMNFNPINKEYIKQGRYAIKAQPKFTTATLYFTVKPTVKDAFRRDRIQALRFYISGGSEPINNDDVSVAVIGSNKYPYWVENDNSVKIEGRVTDGQPVFSETRLVFLNINTAIPKKTFAEVTVWLDELRYDPTYTYITGFYLKTDRQSVPTFYVDKVSLLTIPEGW